MMVLPYYRTLSSSWNDEKSIQTGNQDIIFAMIFILVVIMIALTIIFIALLLKKKYLLIQNDCDGGQLNDLRNSSIIEPQSEIVPYYTQNPNHAIDIGVYDNNGNLILIQKPKPSYNHQLTSLNFPVNINQSFQSASASTSTSSSSDLPPSYTKS